MQRYWALAELENVGFRGGCTLAWALSPMIAAVSVAFGHQNHYRAGYRVEGGALHSLR
jgi:hypothetical protein